tara:strand:+ start:1062 stop:2087 length:1026 start_codon:yes stop_codon:yes gene_type:complete
MRQQSISLSKKNTINDAIKKLNKSESQIILIKNDKNQLIGTVTDGDIRRSLLKKKNFESKLFEIMNKKPFVVKKKISSSYARYLMEKNEILQIPLINHNKKVLKIYYWSKKYSKDKNNLFFLLAGGFGKRLWPLTKNTPKPMIKINNTPIIELILQNAKNQGLKNFFISVFYKKKKIINYFKNKKEFKNIHYTHEKKPLGTAGSLKFLKNKTKLPIIVTNGDTILNINFTDLLRFHKANKAFATMVVKQINRTSKFGVVKTKGSIISDIIEKPIEKININTGMYVLNPKVLSFIGKGKIDMPEVFLNLKKKKKKIIIYPIYDDWVDLGDKVALQNIKAKYK